jgi:hypothetical protein
MVELGDCVPLYQDSHQGSEAECARGVRHKLLTFVYGAESELKEVRFVRKQQQIGYQ